MKTIIAATDFSEASNHAVRFAAGLATSLNARLVIFNVVNIVPAVSDIQSPPDVYEYTIGQADDALADLVAKTKASVNDAIEITGIYKVGAVIRELETLSSREAPFAIFIAPESATVLQRLLSGANAVAITRSSSVPVVVVPATATMRGFRKVGLAIDLAAGDHLQWEFLRYWLKPFRPEIDIVYISADPAGTSRETPGIIDVGGQLDDFILKYHFLGNTDVIAGIKEYVAINAPDLMIMYVGKHGVFHKSITKAFVEAPPVPVMFFSHKLKMITEPHS